MGEQQHGGTMAGSGHRGSGVSLERFYEAAGGDAGIRRAFWSELGAADSPAVARAAMVDLPALLRDAEENADVGDAARAQHAACLALRSRAMLELSAIAPVELDALDARLDEHELTLDLLTDEEYAAALGDTPADDTRWWGRRKQAMAALPLAELERKLLSARTAGRRPPGPSDRPLLRALVGEVVRRSAAALDRPPARAARGVPPVIEFYRVLQSAPLGRWTLDAWLARVDGRLHLRVAAVGNPPPAGTLSLRAPSGVSWSLAAAAHPHAVFGFAAAELLPELRHGVWYQVGAHRGPLDEGLVLHEGDASVPLIPGAATTATATPADQIAASALQRARGGEWVELLDELAGISSEPHEDLRVLVALHLAYLVLSREVIDPLRATLRPAVWTQLQGLTWLGSGLRAALRR